MMREKNFKKLGHREHPGGEVKFFSPPTGTTWGGVFGMQVTDRFKDLVDRYPASQQS
jgi:hypothetical protein